MSTITAIQAEEQARNQPARGKTAPVNVGKGERVMSAVSGGLLAMYGLSRGHLSGLLLTAIGGSLVYRGYSGHCRSYQLLGMNTAHHSPRTSIPAKQGFKFEESVTIMRPAEEVYDFWSDLKNLPRVMPGLISVEPLTDKRSHWIARGPFGNVEWDAEIITQRQNELIGWRSLEGSEVDTAGSVHFRAAPGDRGTEVKVVLRYNPTGGKLGAALAWLMGESPEQEVREGLRSLKQIMEAGCNPTTEGQPRGQCNR